MDEKGVKLPESNYGSCVDYYVVAGSTSEAAAVLAGKIVAGKEDELAKTCKMTASKVKDDSGKRFKINEIDDFSSNDGKTLFKLANGFCIFTKTYTQTMHMEGTVATDLLIRNIEDVIDISNNLIHDIAEDANYYFYFNGVQNNIAACKNKEILRQKNGETPAPMYLGPNLSYAQDGDKWVLTYQNQEVNVGNGEKFISAVPTLSRHRTLSILTEF